MKTPPLNTREKILVSAEKLIYEQGIQAARMDLLVKTSGVARKSIYRYFATKEAIAAAALNARDVRWMTWFRTECERAESPQLRILKMFDVLTEWFESAEFHGCAFINAAGEIRDPQAEARLISKMHKQKLLSYIQNLCEQADCPQPTVLARQLLILIDGAITVALIMGESDAALQAKIVAITLLKQAKVLPEA